MNDCIELFASDAAIQCAIPVLTDALRYWRRKGVDIVSEQVGAERHRLIDQYAPNKRCAKKAAKRVAMSATFDLATRAGRKAARSAKWYNHGHAVNLYLIRG